MSAILSLIPPRIIAMVAIVLMAAIGGYFKGRADGKMQQLRDTVSAYRTREGVDNEVSSLDAIALCRRLGGLPEQCAELRGLEAPAKSKEPGGAGSK